MPAAPQFSVEHVAWNVADPTAVAAWYVENLGMSIVRQADTNGMHFLADASGRVVLEIYRNPAAPVPEYPSQDPLVLHLAFIVDDVKAARDQLCSQGATVANDYDVTPAGDQMAMLRDPWGFAVQLMKRQDPMLRL